MSNSKLPERASLEYLKKLAKDRLQELRRADPGAKLADALLSVAREHGFSSWRALKVEVERQRTEHVSRFIRACAAGDVEHVRTLLEAEPDLVKAVSPGAHYGGWTGLHAAAKAGHPNVIRVLLERGADPNEREAGDNTTPLHWAAARGDLESVRALADASGDVHGIGDVHAMDVIGWAAFFRPQDTSADADQSRRDVVALLLDRGARHHIFSAISIGDLAPIQKVVEDNPDALDRRMSRFEQGQTPLHFAISRKRYDILDLLIELGADLEAQDAHGRTALAAAMLHGDQEAMRRLHRAGAKPPAAAGASSFREQMAGLAGSVSKCVPMIYVPDVARALEWYTSIGFEELARYEDDGLVNFGMVSFGKAEVMLNMHGRPAPHDVSLWFYTDQVDKLYQLLKSRQLESARAVLAGEPGDHPGIEFEQDIEDMFYGVRQFCIRDLNGYPLYFEQPLEG